MPSRDLSTLERELASAYRALVPFLAVRPTNAAAEHLRLVEAWANGRQERPHWQYAAVDTEPTQVALGSAQDALRKLRLHPLIDCYEARLAELFSELTIIRAAGTPQLGRASGARFPLREELESLAQSWAHLQPPQEPDASVGSIATWLRTLIGELRLPFRVEETDQISALAATGEDVVYVARGRRVTERVARRTAVHEVYGHALPRARAMRQPLLIFRFGTAGGHDDQEGCALLREEEHGLLDDGRKREIGSRWLAVQEMRSGASFVDVARGILGRGWSLDEALRLASRVFRGSDGTTGGVGRESAYLEGYEHVRAADKESGRVIAHGQVSCAWAQSLKPFVNYIDR
jgi:hypothetical protein